MNGYALDRRFSIEAFVNYMKQLKEEGKEGIDDVIADLLNKVARDSKESITVQENTRSTHSEDDNPDNTHAIKEKIVEERKSIDTSNLLLYLGAFVFIFAIFIFATYNWASFSAMFKIVLILLIPFAFFFIGLFLKEKEKYQSASATFVLISAFTLGFAGLGVWNFGDFTNILSFWEYWLYYSIFITSAYIGLLNLFDDKRYYYFLLGAIYSVITSISASLAMAFELRIVTFALLNIGFYSMSYMIPNRSKLFDTIPSLVNKIVDVVILLAFLFGAMSYSVEQYYLIVLVLFVPFGFELYEGFVKGKKSSIYSSMLTLVLRLYFLFEGIKVAGDPFAIIISLTVLVIVGILLMFKDDLSKEVYSHIRNFHLVLLALLTFFSIKTGATGLISPDGNSLLYSISDLTLFFIPLTATVGFLSTFLVEKKDTFLGLSLIPLLLAVFSSVHYTIPVIFLLSLATILAIVNIFFAKEMAEKEVRIFASITDVVLWISALALMGDGLGTLWVSIAFFVIAILLMINSWIRQKSSVLVSVIPMLIALGSTFIYITVEVTYKLDFNYLGPVIFMVPAIFYTILIYLKGLGEKSRNNFGVVWFIFSFLAFVLTINYEIALLIVVLLIIATGLIFLLKTGSPIFGNVVGFMFVLWFMLSADSMKAPELLVYFTMAGALFVGQSILLFIKDLIKPEDDNAHIAIKSISMALFWATLIYFVQVFFWVVGNGIPLLSPSTSVFAGHELVLTSLSLVLSSVSIVNSALPSRLKKLSGLGMVLTVWVIAAETSLSTQFFVVALMSYLL